MMYRAEVKRTLGVLVIAAFFFELFKDYQIFDTSTSLRNDIYLQCQLFININFGSFIKQELYFLIRP